MINSPREFLFSKQILPNSSWYSNSTPDSVNDVELGESDIPQKKLPPNTGIIKLPFFLGTKQGKSIVILRDFLYNSALFGLVSYNDPWRMSYSI